MAVLEFAPIAPEFMHSPKPRGKTARTPFEPTPSTLEAIRTILTASGGVQAPRNANGSWKHPAPTAKDALAAGQMALDYVRIVALDLERGDPKVVIVDSTATEFASAKDAQTNGTAPFGYLVRLPGSKRIHAPKETATETAAK